MLYNITTILDNHLSNLYGLLLFPGSVVCLFVNYKIFEQCGMDALMYTLLFRSLLFAFGVCFIPTMAIIIPVNMNGGVGQAGIDRLSVANVTDGSSGLNAHFLLTILYSVAVMTSLRYAYRKVSSKRILDWF